MQTLVIACVVTLEPLLLLYGIVLRPHRTNEILNESNEIASLQKTLELAGREVLLLQNELDNKIRNMSDRTLEMGQVRRPNVLHPLLLLQPAIGGDVIVSLTPLLCE